MPTYVYRCRKCGHTFTDVQKITEPALTECIHIDSEGPCEGGEVYRVMQPVGIVFKGSGFYTTDYKRAGGQVVEKDTRKDQLKVSF